MADNGVAAAAAGVHSRANGVQGSQPTSESDTRQLRVAFNNVVLTKLRTQMTDDEDIRSLFECVTRCVTDIPWLLVQMINAADEMSSHSSAVIQNRRDSTALTRWLITQVFQLAGKLQSKCLHSLASDSLASIFRLAQTNNLVLFNVITNDLVVLATAVCEADLKFAAGECTSTEIDCLPQGLGDLYDQSSLQLNIEPLVVLDRDGIDRMLHLLLQLMCEVASGIVLYPRVVSSVWPILCHIIASSTMLLKKLALSVIKLVTDNDECPHNPYIHHYLVSVLLALVEFLYESDNIDDSSELEEFESTLSSILPKLLLKVDEDGFNREECASVLCKVHSRVGTKSMRVALSDIIIRLIVEDQNMTIPWTAILPMKFQISDDVEWLSIAKFHVIKRELEICDCNVEKASPTWKLLIEQFNQCCKEPRNIDSILEGLSIACDILAVIVVMAKNELHNSECSLVLEEVNNVLLEVITTNCNWPAINVTQLYELVILYSLLVLRLQDWEPLFREYSLTLTSLLSLPWLQLTPTTFDLPCAKLLNNKSLLSSAKDHLSESYKCKAILVLAMLPSEIAINWRVFIFKRELVSKENCLASASLKSLAWLLHMIGLPYFDPFEQCLRIILKDKFEFVDHNKLINLCLRLTCVLYGGSTVEWCADGANKYTTKSKLKCSGVSTSAEDEAIEAFCGEMWEFLFAHPNSDVRRDVARNLPHLVLHFGGKDMLLELCLPYLEDSSYDVRREFSRCTEFFANCLSVSTKADRQSYFLSRIQAIYRSAKGKGDFSTLETLIISISSLAKASHGDIFQFAVIFLLENIQSANIWARVAGTLQLREVALYKKLKPKQLFVNCCCSISKFLCKSLYDAQERGDKSPLDVMESTVHAFALGNINCALQLMLRYLLPRLLENINEHTRQLVHVIANHLNLTPRTIIFNEFRYIFCHLICSCTQDIRNKVLVYIVKETEATIDDILLNHSQLIYNELMLHLASNKEEAIAALKSLPSRGKQSSALLSTEMFLGFLAFFDGYIFNKDIGIENKQLAVKSLEEAIRLMGPKNLSTVHMKAMATLRITLRISDNSIIPLCCRAWLAFIQTLDPMVVGSTLSQIVVTLLPLVNTCIEGIKQILEYIIIERRSVFQNYFCDLYCIPDVPQFSPFIKIIKESLGKPRSKKDLKEILQPIINGVLHENIDVRTHILSYLNDLLMQQQVLFESLIMEEDSVDQTISQLIDQLMMACRDSDPLSQNLIGQCLGKLGAIDPSRLQIESHHSMSGGKASNVYLTIEDEGFVIELLTTLTKAFLGAPDNFVQNSASYAIQEILQLYKITGLPDKSSTSAERIWSGLPEHVKDNLGLLFHSRFVCEENLDYNQLCGRPIYNSPFGLTFSKWLSTWTEYLISKVSQVKAKNLFWVCRKIVRHDIKVALFLLPHVLLSVIQEDNHTYVEEVVEEISTVLKNSVETKLQVEADLHRMSVQLVFTVIDHLSNWILIRKRRRPPSGRKMSSPAELNQVSEVESVSSFLERIPKYLLAMASYNAQTYARALMNIEAHVKSEPKSLDSHLNFFLKLYTALDEPDGVAGVTHFSQEQTMHNQILSHENAGRHQDALLCYQRAIATDPNEPQFWEGYLRCLMDLDSPRTALVYSTGILSLNPCLVRPLKSYQVEAAWRLASWEALDSYLESDEPLNPTWGYQIGKILAAVSHRDKTKYLKELEICRRNQMLPMSAASLESGSYERAYEHVLRFHMLEEIDQAVGTFLVAENEGNRNQQVNHLIDQWQNRQKIIRTSKRCLEPVLNLRRVLLGMAADQFGQESSASMQLEISRLWLQSAKIARRCSQLQPDYSSILSSYIHVLPEVGPEQAKWHWLKGEKEQAMICLGKTITEIYPCFSDVTPNMKAKAKLLLARYSEESSNLESTVIIQMFRDVLEISPEREDSHYFIARYFDRILSVAGQIDKRTDMALLVVKHFGQSLKYGCRYVHLSMPRLLSLWLEFGSLVVDTDKTSPRTSPAGSNLHLNALRKTLAVMHSKLIHEFTTTIPSYLFYTAFSQLISRICHSHNDVFNHLKEIIAKLLVDYPQQSIWLMTAVSKSSYTIRARRCQQIFHRACQMSPRLAIFQADVNKLTDLLVKLCNMPVDMGFQQLKVSTHCRGLKQLLENPGFSQIILPCQSSLTVTLPSTQLNSSTTYSPFPSSQVFIQSIEEPIDVMPSLQRPKKITIRGNDGKLYSIMCKPKDDLRKDCRLMEFNLVVNKFLMKDPESRRRHLHIRTYAVVPLNEECGLIEWVPNLNGLRNVLNDIYKERNIYVTGQTLKTLAPNRLDSTLRKVEVFKTKLLPLFPSVLSEWFLRTFPSPISWYFARSSYARTAAVMSMVGYVLGLGDRHGENILLDASCGDIVHVDFNCLFNKGETFEWPEVVPFRLTHNMVDALGPLGCEGVYRKSCETTMRVMRKEMDTLMSFLKPFIYDPLVEWSRSARNQSTISSRGGSVEQGEVTNEMAKVHVQDIEQRLTGVLKNKDSGGQGKKTQASPFPLSVEGQVATLIKQATDETNLSLMYVGWAAYM